MLFFFQFFIFNMKKMNSFILERVSVIEKNIPFLVPYSIETLKYLKKWLANENNKLSIEQAFFIQYLLGDISAINYQRVSISKLNLTLAHNPHYGFRNEFWKLQARLSSPGKDDIYLTFLIWRHNPTVNKDSSLVKIIGNYSILDKIYPFNSTFSDYFFGNELDMFSFYKTEYHKLASFSSRTLFPMDFKWKFENHDFYIEMDNVSPPFMINSNGCSPCSDGVGTKRYCYSNIKGSATINSSEKYTAEAIWTHSWESGVTSGGYSASFFLRTIDNIEKLLKKKEKKQILEFTTRLENNIVIQLFIQPVPDHTNTIKANTCRIIKPTGEVLTREIAFFQVVEFDSEGFIKKCLVTSTNFKLDVTSSLEKISQPISNLPNNPVLFCDSVMQVKASYNQINTDGYAFLKQPNKTRIKEHILHSLTTEDKTNMLHKNNFSREVFFSILVWLVPLLIILCIFIEVFFIIFTRNNQQKKLLFKNKV